MEILADTSGLYALLDRGDRNHEEAVRSWEEMLRSDDEIVAHFFVLQEVWTLLQARFGFEAVETFFRDFLPLLELVPVDTEVLHRAMTRCRASRKRDLSLTDCASIEFMAERGIRSAFAFDRHFREEGIRLPGSPSWPGE